MAQVTIEGSRTTPTTFLAPGAQITVERTKYIDNLLRRGYVNLIGTHDPIRESVSGIVKVEAAPAEPTHDELIEDEFGAPPVSATKAVWRSFLEDRGFGITDDATKAEMLEAWEGRSGGPTD